MFDSILHQPNRLKILSILAVNEMVSFKQLQEILGLTKGNLSSHMKALNNEEYILIEKFFEDNRPKTIYRISDKGRVAFNDYILYLEKFLKDIKP